MKSESVSFIKKTIIAFFILATLAALTAILYLTIKDYRTGVLLKNAPDAVLQKMTLEEKVGQIIHVGIRGKNPDELAIRDIQKLHAGGVILFAANLGDKESIIKLNSDLQTLSISSSGIPLFISIDQEGGRVARIPDDSSPGALAMGQTGNALFAEEVGFFTAHNLRNLGFNMNLAPVMDVNSNPDNPVINTRSFGGDPELVASMGISHAKGIREALVVPVLKHFPGHGDTNTDSHLDLPKISKSIQDLEKMELIPFRKSIENGTDVIMSAHILFPALDDELPATLSPKILRGLLREKLKYDGIVMTDAMEMHAISKRFKPEESAKKAFQAGADIILLTSTGPDTEKIYNSLLLAFKNKELDVADLNKSVLRQITLKFRYGYFHALHSKYADEKLGDYFFKKDEEAERIFSVLSQKYNKTSLYEVVAKDGVRSLRHEYRIPDYGNLKNVKLFYSTAKMRDLGISRGIPAENMYPLSADFIFANLIKNPSGFFMIMEVQEWNLAVWNAVVLKMNEYLKSGGKISVAPAALYTGNPFLDIRVPDEGAVIASFSPTDESMRALLDTCLEKKVVRKADLFLHAEK